LTLKDLKRLASKRRLTGGSTRGPGSRLRPGDLRNAEKFWKPHPPLSLGRRLRCRQRRRNPQRLPVHRFTARRHGLQGGAGASTQQKAPDFLPAPVEGFCGQLRPYQEAGPGLAGLSARFDHWRCLADDMGLEGRLSCWPSCSTSKSRAGKLKRRLLLVAPHLVLHQLERREATGFTTRADRVEHYGPRRPHAGGPGKALQGVDLGLLTRRPAATRQRAAGLDGLQER